MEKKASGSYQSQYNAAEDDQDRVYENDNSVFENSEDLAISADIGSNDEENSSSEVIKPDNEASLILSVRVFSHFLVFFCGCRSRFADLVSDSFQISSAVSALGILV